MTDTQEERMETINREGGMSDYLTAILMVAITAGLCILALSCAMDCPYPREQLVQSYDYWTGAVRVRPFVTCGKE